MDNLFYAGRSPLFAHFSTTLLGLDTIRAFGVQDSFNDQINTYQDAHSRTWFTYLAAQSWLNVRLEMLAVLFLAFVAFVSPALKGSECNNGTALFHLKVGRSWLKPLVTTYLLGVS